MTSQEQRFPEGVFTLMQAERDELPAVAMVNLAYSDYPFRAEFPWLVSITIRLADTNDAGLPTNAEAEVLNAIEDQFEAALTSATEFHHIARQSWNGLRVIDYYVADDQAARQTFEAQAGALPREVSLEIERDEEWAAWLPTLMSCACP